MQTEEARLNEFVQLLHSNQHERLAEQLAATRAQDIAFLLMELEEADRFAAFKHLPQERRADVFSHIDKSQQLALLASWNDDDKRVVLSNLLPDDLTDLLEALPKEQVEHLLRLLPQKAMRRAMTLLGYPADSAGRLMTPDYFAVKADQTIGEALEAIRNQTDRYETVNTIFVVDDNQLLVNMIPLRRFVSGAPEDSVSTLIKDEESLVTIGVSADEAEAVRIMRHYDLSVLPVVDPGNHLLGIVTVDDVLDVAEEEATEDFQRMGAVGHGDDGSGLFNISLRDARPSLLYRKRIGWLLILVFVNVFGGAAIAQFEDAIEALVVLVFFLPLVIDSGGNAGTQSATLMVRALATGDVKLSNWLKLFTKELSVAAALGITMAVAVAAVGLWRGGMEVALVVAISMILVVVVGSLIGMLLPFIFTRIKLDPATASGPLITSIADLSGIVMYFSVATAILNL